MSEEKEKEKEADDRRWYVIHTYSASRSLCPQRCASSLR
jgi:hypothetical protein